MKTFDLIVIGAGSGLDVMSAAASKGLKVALVEEGPMGGTCLNRGCIPTKILVHTADVVRTIQRAGEFGIDAKLKSIDFKAIMHRAMDEVDKDARSIEESILESPNITLFKGRGRFIGPKTIQVGEEIISAEKVLVAAGTRPAVPPITGLDKVPYMTSDEALRLDALPKELMIIGGGYIAVELAHFFGAMGSKVTLLQRNVRLVPNEDEEIGQRFTEISSKRFDVRLGFAVAGVRKEGRRVVVQSKDGASVSGTHLLIATGRVPNTDILDVQKTGLEMDQKGYLKVNGFMETNVAGIWALGDIAGKYLFKHSANLEAEMVTRNLLYPEHKAEVVYYGMPHAVFSDPQIAGVGSTEQDLKAKGEDYLVGRYEYSKTGMGTALMEKEGFVKFLSDYEGKILGCHIMGPEAATLIHEVLVEMRAGRSLLKDIINTIHIHPSLSEVVQRGAAEV